MALTFDWDPDKAAANRGKHGVTFEEATTVFGDPLARMVDDAGHSEHEQRFILFGRSHAGRMLAVMHTARGDAIRLISAREMTSAERKQYAEFQL